MHSHVHVMLRWTARSRKRMRFKLKYVLPCWGIEVTRISGRYSQVGETTSRSLSLESTERMINRRPGSPCYCTPRGETEWSCSFAKTLGTRSLPIIRTGSKSSNLNVGSLFKFSCLEFNSNEAKFTNLLALLFFFSFFKYLKTACDACLLKNNGKTIKKKITYNFQIHHNHRQTSWIIPLLYSFFFFYKNGIL